MISILKSILYLLNKKQKITLSILIFSIFIGSCLEILGLSLIVPLIKIALDPNIKFNNRFISNLLNVNSINSFFLLVFFLYLIKNIYLSLLVIFQFKWATYLQLYFSKKLFSKYINKPYIYHLSKNSSTIFKNLEEVDMFGRSVNNSVSLISEIFLIFIIVIFLLYSYTITAFISFLFILLIAVVYFKFSKRKLINYGIKRQKFLELRIKSIRESFGNAIKEAKINSYEDLYTNFYNQHNQNYSEMGLKTSVLQEMPKFLLEQMAILLFFVTTVLYSLTGKSNTELISTLGLFLIVIIRIIPSLRKILFCSQYINFGLASINLIKNELKDNEDNIEIIPKKNYEKIISSDLNFYKVVFDNVSFIYPDQKSYVIKDLNFEIKKDEIIGIYGKSGSGKSTLVNLLAGLLNPTYGRILIDNMVINEIRKFWQKKIGYVSQNTFLMDCNIIKNIAFAKNESRIDTNIINSIIKNVGLEDFIKNLPFGLETNVGELGAKLSGGQIQRIAIARALYRNPKLIIFDEATNALDQENEENIFRLINKYKKEKMIVIISHKMENLENCDKILELTEKSWSIRKNKK